MTPPRATQPGNGTARYDPRKTARLERDVAEPIEDLVHDAEARVQAEVEGVPFAETVEFLGAKYRVAPKVGLMPMLKFAHSAAKGTESGDMEGMAAMYDMLRACIWPADWDKFERAAIDGQADDGDLLAVVARVTEIVAARPTPPPSASSPPARRRSARSRASSSSVPEAFRSADMINVADALRSAP